MQNKPWLSIIIPTLNESANIGPLLTYLRTNGGGEIEILVVDGGSTDDTCSRAREQEGKLLEVGRGRALQMNCGAQQAKGEVLYFVHADSIPPVSFVKDIQKAIATGYSYGGFRFRFNSPRRIFRINDFFTRFDWSWTRGGDQTLFITKELFETLGGYDEYFVIMEEYDLIKRARAVAGGMFIVPKDVVGSPRKYECNSYLRVNLANLLVFQGYVLGVSPPKLKNWYSKFLRPPKMTELS